MGEGYTMRDDERIEHCPRCGLNWVTRRGPDDCPACAASMDHDTAGALRLLDEAKAMSGETRVEAMRRILYSLRENFAEGERSHNCIAEIREIAAAAPEETVEDAVRRLQAANATLQGL